MASHRESTLPKRWSAESLLTRRRATSDPLATIGAIIGTSVDIGDKRVSDFRAFDGALTGRMIDVVRPRLIVQSWGSVNFLADDADSTLISSFTSEGDEGLIDLVHLDVPDQDYEGVNQGWENYYWIPWP